MAPHNLRGEDAMKNLVAVLGAFARRRMRRRESAAKGGYAPVKADETLP